jgi:hypothetical protein
LPGDAKIWEFVVDGMLFFESTMNAIFGGGFEFELLWRI